MKTTAHKVDFLRRSQNVPYYKKRRGSVLMEFIIVFPIYLVLFGGVFMIGDMVIKTARLASAERTRAFDIAADDRANSNADAGWNAIRELLFPPVAGDAEDKITEKPAPVRYHAQGTEFRGPWTVSVGSKIQDAYKLPAWTRGWLKFAHWFFADATGDADELDTGDNVMLPLLNGRSAMIFSKNWNKGVEYNYYTYRRTRDYTSSDLPKMYRAMPRAFEDAGRIVDAKAKDASWNKFVFRESFPALDDTGNIRSVAMPELSRREYLRYPQFERWSE